MKRASNTGNVVSSFRNRPTSGDSLMRRVSEIVDNYDSSNEKNRKKIILIEWFQKRPGKRFDKSEVHQELGDELDVGQRRVGDYLSELESEDVLQSYGQQRISYRLEDDILIPVRYQVQTGFRHIFDIFGMNRWGSLGFLVVATTFWAIMTLPFLFFSLILFVTPRSQIAMISEYEMFIFTISMMVWLILFSVVTVFFVRFRRWVSIRAK